MGEVEAFRRALGAVGRAVGPVGGMRMPCLRPASFSADVEEALLDSIERAERNLAGFRRRRAREQLRRAGWSWTDGA